MNRHRSNREQAAAGTGNRQPPEQDNNRTDEPPEQSTPPIRIIEPLVMGTGAPLIEPITTDQEHARAGLNNTL